MTAVLGSDRRRVVLTAVLTAGVLGTLVPGDPVAAVLLVAAVPIALWAPVARLTLALALTLVVPFDALDAFSIVGGPGRPGLLVVDVLVMVGMVRVVATTLAGRRPGASPVLLAALAGLVVIAAAGIGVAHGATLSAAGHEARRVGLGVGGFVLAVPVLRDPALRARLYPQLAIVGAVLGVWGLLQWGLDLQYGSGGDVGVRTGHDVAVEGHGQLQGGLFGYAVVVTLAFAALPLARPERGRVALVGVLGINLVCLVLTFERTFWGAAVVSGVAVLVLAGRDARRVALRRLPLAVGVLVLGLAVVVPSDLGVAADRAASVTDVGADDSVASRLVESRAVLAEIGAHPLTGAGLGAMLTWGERNRFATTTTPFVHNGYLWAAWKLGVPLALVLVALLVAAVLRRGPPDEVPPDAALRVGSRAAIAGLLVVTVTFSTFDTLSITTALGFLLAVAFTGPDARADARAAR